MTKESNPTRRSILQKAAAGSGAVVLGSIALTGTAVAQEGVEHVKTVLNFGDTATTTFQLSGFVGGNCYEVKVEMQGKTIYFCTKQNRGGIFLYNTRYLKVSGSGSTIIQIPSDQNQPITRQVTYPVDVTGALPALNSGFECDVIPDTFELTQIDLSWEQVDCPE